jgi:hypothetical protein
MNVVGIARVADALFLGLAGEASPWDAAEDARFWGAQFITI